MHSVIYETAPPGCIKTNRNVQGKIVRIYGTLIKDRFFRVKEKVLLLSRVRSWNSWINRKRIIMMGSRPNRRLSRVRVSHSCDEKKVNHCIKMLLKRRCVCCTYVWNSGQSHREKAFHLDLRRNKERPWIIINEIQRLRR